MAGLQVKALQKRYGSAVILKGIDLDVRDGEFVVLVGPSGCGKSTLLRMIAGLDEISDGELWIGSKLANKLSPQQRNISMVFQSYALFPHMTTRANIGFGPRMRGESAQSIEPRVKKAASVLNLHDYLDRYPRQLSGGQRQRVAMGRTIVRQPELFLFDEPLSNLDAKLRVQMRAEIKELHQRLKTTTIYVTHDQIEAMTMADRIVVLHDGIIEQVGSPLELYDRPANLFVAGFIGSPAMNFIKGRLETSPAPRVVTDDGVELPVPAIPAGSEGRRVVYGIRPEHFSLGGSLQARITVVEPTGAETQVFAQLGEQRVLGVFRERITAGSGEILALQPDLAAVHLFDAETGLRLN